MLSGRLSVTPSSFAIFFYFLFYTIGFIENGLVKMLFSRDRATHSWDFRGGGRALGGSRSEHLDDGSTIFDQRSPLGDISVRHVGVR